MNAMRCEGCNANLTDGTAVCPSCGKEVEDRYLGFPMAWYKFLIYFGLWFSALREAANGLVMMTGSSFGASRDAIFQMYPKVELVGIVFGTLCWAMAFLIVGAAITLRGLKKSGPVLLLACYGGDFLLPIAEAIMLSRASEGLLTAVDLLDASKFMLLMGEALFFALNLVYFRKRAVLFR